MEKVCIMGLGYIGLPTAIIAAESGFEVVGFDVNKERVESINKYDPTIQEPEICDKLGNVLDKNAFHATTVLVPADYFVIAVPTPFKEEKKADLSYLWHAATLLIQVLKKGNVVIIESTIPVGTTDQLAAFLETKTGLKAGVDIFIAHCPERVLPGRIFKELVENARIIGGINTRSVDHAKLFYKKFVTGQLYLTNAKTAEMVKLVENSSRDVEIAFANQVAAMSYAVGLDPFEVIELANKHPRVSILNPSCGVGGHCIAVDPWFLVETFPAQSQLLKTARTINDEKPHQVIAVIRNQINAWQRQHTKIPKVLALGVTYKPNVDDMRESPALFITKKLSRYLDVELLVCEPHVPQATLHTALGQADIVSLQEGITRADIIVCLVKHSAFTALDLTAWPHTKVLDFCGLFYKPRADSSEQEKMFWPASSSIFTLPEETEFTHSLNHESTLAKETNS